MAQHAVLFGAQPGDGVARGVVVPVGAQLHGDRLQAFEGVAEQQQFAFAVHGAALEAARVPGVPQLQPAVVRIGAEKAGAADHPPAFPVAHRERQVTVPLAALQGGLDIGGDPVRRRHEGVPQFPELAVGGGVGQRLGVVGRQRLQHHVLAVQRDRFDPYRHGCHPVGSGNRQDNGYRRQSPPAASVPAFICRSTRLRAAGMASQSLPSLVQDTQPTASLAAMVRFTR